MNDVPGIRVFDGVRPHRIDADEYLRMIEAGAFGDDHVELVDGELIEVAPSQTAHSRMIDRIYRALIAELPQAAFSLLFDTMIRIGDRSVRAPDLSVVDRDIESHPVLLPEHVLLAIEVSDTTLHEDLGRKRLDYARAGIRNYWVVDLGGRRVHCFARPTGEAYADEAAAAFGAPLDLPVSGKQMLIKE